MTDASVSRCGYVAIVGRPNVGKSTLLNHILGQKLAITSRKPQTTRHNMLGIKTEGAVQAIYVDTPGLHKNNEKALNRFMNKTASSALKDVDVVIFVVDRTRWTDEDQLVLDRVKYVEGPLLLAVNKADRIEDKSDLLPHLGRLKLIEVNILQLALGIPDSVGEAGLQLSVYGTLGVTYRIGGGALLGTSQAILVETWPKEQLGMATALFGLGVVVGPTLGPTLGGFITDHWSWPWITFLLGLVLGWILHPHIS